MHAELIEAIEALAAATPCTIEELPANLQVAYHWAKVIRELHALPDYLVGPDDHGMITAEQTAIFEWAYELEARFGYDIARLHSAMIDFVINRDGE